MKRIFFIKWHEPTYSGADTFLEQFFLSLSNEDGLEFNVIELSSSVEHYSLEKKDSIKFHRIGYDASMAFTILKNNGIISDSVDNLFIQNYCPASLMLKYIKTDFPNSKCIYIIHDIMWLSWFMGDVNAYINVITDKETKGYGNDKINFFKALYHDCRKACLMADVVVTLNPETMDLLINLFKISINKIRLIRNGISDIYADTHSQQKMASRSPKKFLFCGRFTPQKGFFTLLNAFNEIAQSRNDFELICCGGNIEDDNKNLSIESASLTYIRWEGIVERQKVAQLMRECDCVIFPSFYEQSGYVAIEAKMAGKPLIVSNGFGVRDLAENKSAIIFDSGNSTSLKEKIIEFLNMEKFEIRQLSEQSREDFNKRYKLDIMKEKYMALFCDLWK